MDQETKDKIYAKMKKVLAKDKVVIGAISVNDDDEEVVSFGFIHNMNTFEAVGVAETIKENLIKNAKSGNEKPSAGGFKDFIKELADSIDNVKTEEQK